MLVYFKIKRALNKLQNYICKKFFQCKVVDANTAIFRHSKLYACIKVNTDKQKIKLKSEGSLASIFKQFLIDSGFPSENINRHELYVESQETVERDFDGNWYFALFQNEVDKI
jgi:hypothetical protein